MAMAISPVKPADPLLHWRNAATDQAPAERTREDVQDADHKINPSARADKRGARGYAQPDGPGPGEASQGVSSQLLERILSRSRNLLQQQAEQCRSMAEGEVGESTLSRHAAENCRQAADVSINDEDVRGSSSELLNNILSKADPTSDAGPGVNVVA